MQFSLKKTAHADMSALNLALLCRFIQYQQMSKTPLVFLIFCIIAYTALAQKTMTVTCQTCGTNVCASGYCYKLVGSSFSDTVCVAEGKSCNLQVNQQISLNNCTYDYMSTPCSSGVCFSILDKPIALLGGSCASGYSQYFTCGQCVATICSGNLCQVNKKSTDSKQTVSCIDGCPTVTSNNLTVVSCSGGQDVLGVTNNCCMTFSTNQSAVCTTQSLPLQSVNMHNWVKGTSAQSYLTMLFMSLLVLYLAIFN